MNLQVPLLPKHCHKKKLIVCLNKVTTHTHNIEQKNEIERKGDISRGIKKDNNKNGNKRN
jgi:hypothetical protein